MITIKKDDEFFDVFVKKEYKKIFLPLRKDMVIAPTRKVRTFLAMNPDYDYLGSTTNVEEIKPLFKEEL